MQIDPAPLDRPMQTVYVSGPMTGYPEFNTPAFVAAERRLMDLGYEVVSPHHVLDPSKTWADCQRVDLRRLLDCDAVVLLPGWSDSRGSKLERHVALALGMRVHELADVVWPCLKETEDEGR